MWIFPGGLFQGRYGLTLVITDTVEINFRSLAVIMPQDPLDIAEAGPSLVQNRRTRMPNTNEAYRHSRPKQNSSPLPLIAGARREHVKARVPKEEGG